MNCGVVIENDGDAARKLNGKYNINKLLEKNKSFINKMHES